jgi:hypothetical protein
METEMDLTLEELDELDRLEGKQVFFIGHQRWVPLRSLIAAARAHLEAREYARKIEADCGYLIFQPPQQREDDDDRRSENDSDSHSGSGADFDLGAVPVAPAPSSTDEPSGEAIYRLIEPSPDAGLVRPDMSGHLVDSDMPYQADAGLVERAKHFAHNLSINERGISDGTPAFIDELAAALEAKDAEIERLREALEKIADEKIIGTLYPTQIARAALGEKP